MWRYDYNTHIGNLPSLKRGWLVWNDGTLFTLLCRPGYRETKFDWLIKSSIQDRTSIHYEATGRAGNTSRKSGICSQHFQNDRKKLQTRPNSPTMALLLTGLRQHSKVFSRSDYTCRNVFSNTVEIFIAVHSIVLTACRLHDKSA